MTNRYKCIKDFYMECGDRTFTRGITYKVIANEKAVDSDILLVDDEDTPHYMYTKANKKEDGYNFTDYFEKSDKNIWELIHE